MYMPLAHKYLDKYHIEFYESISENEIKSIIGNKDARVLLTNSPVNELSWKLINDLLLSARPDIEIRISGHNSQNWRYSQ